MRTWGVAALSLFLGGIARAEAPIHQVAWAQKCYEDWEDLRARWGPVEEVTRAALKDLAGKSFYEAFPKLREAYHDLAKEAHHRGLGGGASLAQAVDDGLGFEVALAIVELQRRTGRTFERYFARPSLFQRGHRATGRADFDKNHYCERAWHIGTHRRPAGAPDPYENTIELPWMGRADFERFDAEELKLYRESLQAFEVEADPARPVEAEWGSIERVTKAGAKTRVAFAHMEPPLVCTKTDRVKRVREDGSVELAVDCVPQKTRVDYKGTVSFAELPPGGLKAGDYFRFVGYPTGATRDHGFEGLHVVSLSRGADLLGNWNLADDAQ